MIDRMLSAIRHSNFEVLEVLRDRVNPRVARQLAREWRADLPWEHKDGFVFLLSDELVADVPELGPMMTDGLDAPNVHTRACALYSLAAIDHDRMFIGPNIAPEMVDAEVAAYRAGR